MRVIAGTAKGTRLAPVPRGVRPVSDMAREGLFASVARRVPGARVLDLYAGTGALGIEALSRGAEGGVFVERNGAALRAIRTNLDRTGLSGRAEVVSSDVLAFLRRNRNVGERPDLVFVDPPYKVRAAEVDAALAELAARWLPEKGWTVVLTRAKRGYTPVIPVDWLAARRLEYGDTLVFLYREV